MNKTVKIEDKTKDRLTALKDVIGFSTYSAVIDYLLVKESREYGVSAKGLIREGHRIKIAGTEYEVIGMTVDNIVIKDGVVVTEIPKRGQLAWSAIILGDVDV